MGEKARRHLRLLESLRHWLTVFRSEVHYSGTTLGELSEQLAENDDMWNVFFKNLSKEINSGCIEKNISKLWEESFDASGVASILSQSDKTAFIRFGHELGCMDKASQLGRIDLYLENVSLRIAELDKGLSEKVRLCRLLGIAGGIFITILIV